MVKTLLCEEAIRYLRSAQNIIRLKKKYGSERLEAASRRAVYYCNYSYGGVKNILEHELDHQSPELLDEEPRHLSSRYARDLSTLLTTEAHSAKLRSH
jgi:hypothetical protein